MFENQTKKNSVAMKPNHLRAIVSFLMLRRDDRACRPGRRPLRRRTGGGSGFFNGSAIILRGDHEQRDDGREAGQPEQQDGLVDRHVERSDVDLDPRVELELVLRLEVLVDLDRVGGDRVREQERADRQRDREVAGAGAAEDLIAAVHSPAPFTASDSSKKTAHHPGGEVDGEDHQRQHDRVEAGVAVDQTGDQQRGRHDPGAASAPPASSR